MSTVRAPDRPIALPMLAEAWLVACVTGDLTHLINLRAKGCPVDLKNPHGDTGLIIASRHGQTAVVCWLLGQGADVNAQNIYGNSALMVAGFRSRPEVVACLIKAGADVRAKNDLGTPVLSFGACSEIITNMLLSTPAFDDANTADLHGVTPIMQAVDLIDPDSPQVHWDQVPERCRVIELLTKAGSDPNAINCFNRTALMAAAHVGSMELVDALLAAGARPEVLAPDGRRAVDHAQEPAIIKKLLHHDNLYMFSGKVRALHPSKKPPRRPTRHPPPACA